MRIFPTPILPKNILAILRRSPNHVGVAPDLIEMAGSHPAEVLGRLNTTEAGLSEDEAARRLDEYGPNVVAQEQRAELVVEVLHHLRAVAGRRLETADHDARLDQ